MAAKEQAEKFYLEKEEVPVDVDEDYAYETVPVDEDFVTEDKDEDLILAVQKIEDKSKDDAAALERESLPKASITTRPEVVDDFVRNFLARMGMTKTLDCFQMEWYQKYERGELDLQDMQVVPDVYVKNQELDSDVRHLRVEVERYRDAALKAKETFVKLRKERDYHRMHHKRVVQEKNKLITDLKRLRNHYSDFEPTLQELKQKYEVALKEKMLSKLERDRAVAQLGGLQSTIRTMQAYKLGSKANSAACSRSATDGMMTEKRGSAVIVVDKNGLGPTQRAVQHARQQSQLSAADPSPQVRAVQTSEQDSAFPQDVGINPLLAHVKGPSNHLTRSGGFRLTNTWQAHDLPVSSVALHPRKDILATTSDDHIWKMWAVPSGEIVMSGEGHTDWLSHCAFHPDGSRLATASGDTTVKIWDFSQSQCVHTFTDHTHAVWECSWHSCGDFIASASMDKTAKILDLNSLRCRCTLRGHTDSVNSIKFLYYSNTLATSSADKTVSLWDARNGLCAHTFYGHMHSVNDVQFNLKGDTLASCDSFGEVRLWDVRTNSPMVTANLGPHPANALAFDSSGMVLAVASIDGTVKMYEIATGQTLDLVGHEEAVQCCTFDFGGDFLVTGGSDATVRIWS